MPANLWEVMSFMIGAEVRGKLRVPRILLCKREAGMGPGVAEGLGAAADEGAGEACVLVRLRLAGTEVEAAISRERRVSRRRRVERRVSSAVVVERREGASDMAGVAGSGFMGEMVGDIVLPRRACDLVPLRLEDVERGLAVLVKMSWSWVDGASGGEAARSLMGLISSGPGRVGEPMVQKEPGSPRPFHRVEEAGVTNGDGRGGRGFPDALTSGVC